MYARLLKINLPFILTESFFHLIKAIKIGISLPLASGYELRQNLGLLTYANMRKSAWAEAVHQLFPDAVDRDYGTTLDEILQSDYSTGCSLFWVSLPTIT